MKKNRQDLLREFKRDMGHSAKPDVLEQFESFGEDVSFEIEEEFEETFEKEVYDTENEEFLCSDLGIKIADKWDKRAEEIKEAWDKVEGVNDMLDDIPDIIEYIKWLEEKLEDR